LIDKVDFSFRCENVDSSRKQNVDADKTILFHSNVSNILSVTTLFCFTKYIVYYETYLIRDINISEFIYYAWTKNDKRTVFLGIINITYHFNVIARFILGIILNEYGLIKREIVLKNR
jgi:hypothetical protein